MAFGATLRAALTAALRPRSRRPEFMARRSAPAAAAALLTIALSAANVAGWTRHSEFLASSSAAASSSSASGAPGAESCSFSVQLMRRGDEQLLRDMEALRARCDGVELRSELSAQRLKMALDERLYQLWNSTETLAKSGLQHELQMSELRGGAKDLGRSVERLADELGAVRKKLKSLNTSSSGGAGDERKFKKETPTAAAAAAAAAQSKLMQSQYNEIMSEVFLMKDREEKIAEEISTQKAQLDLFQAQLTNLSMIAADLEEVLRRSVRSNHSASSAGGVSHHGAAEAEASRHSGRTQPRDCSDHYALGHQMSGMYDIYMSSFDYPTQVYCHMANGAAWTVIQRRTDGTLSFDRGWTEYEFGFGNLYGEFWFGNAYLNLLTSQWDYRLRVEAEDWSGGRGWAEYNMFRVGDRSRNYPLVIGKYVGGTLGDALTAYNNTPFSSRDDGNDLLSSEGSLLQSGWWHKERETTNLNGNYYDGGQNSEKALASGITWTTWEDSSHYSLKRVVMKVAPVH